MARKPIVAGNWKMNGLVSAAIELGRGVRRETESVRSVEVVVAPVFTALDAVAKVIGDSPIGLSGQNCHFEKSGAFTGEISAEMLRDVGCTYVILGHSERRAYFGETDELINRKVFAALAEGLRPILCVGETLEQREQGPTTDVVRQQLEGSLAGLDADGLGGLVLAYEPVWAIGTGRTASPEQAQEVHLFIRQWWAGRFGADSAANTRFQYGGSAKPDNAGSLIVQPDIDGFLVGGASLKPASFAGIIDAVRSQL